MTSATTTLQTPMGLLRITANDTEIERITFCKGDDKAEGNTSHPLLQCCAQELDAYFTGECTTFSVPLMQSGTIFQKAVWNALQHIPNGETISYGELACKAGYPQAARAVGTAMKKNPFPVIIPCHRVLPSDQSVGQYVGGSHCKKWLLEHEQSMHRLP